MTAPAVGGRACGGQAAVVAQFEERLFRRGCRRKLLAALPHKVGPQHALRCC